MESHGDKLGEAAVPTGGIIDEKHHGVGSEQDLSGFESAKSDQAGADDPTDSAEVNRQSVPDEGSTYGEDPHPSEPIFGAVQRHFNDGDESE